MVTKARSSTSNQKTKKEPVEDRVIEDIYKQKDPRSHIYELPDTYIGSIRTEKRSLAVFNEPLSEEDNVLVFKEIDYVPGFYKIYDEIIVNSADHATRDAGCDVIKVWIDKETGRITVWNNGDGIDVCMHKEVKLWVPTMLFGELRTSANYDKKGKVTGGKNGLGAKLTNIFSVQFEVETLDARTDQKFSQVWYDNMTRRDEEKIVSGKGKAPYTKISFIPEFKRFGMKGFTDDIYNLFVKRIYDIAASTSTAKKTTKVYFNDNLIACNQFTKYMSLYFPDTEDSNNTYIKVIDDKSNPRWRVGVIFDTTNQMDHQSIAFVNNICTPRGGRHVDHVVDKIVADLKEYVLRDKDLKKYHKSIKPATIKENLIFFIDSIIEDPDFDTQTKEYLSTLVGDFGSKYVVTEAFIKKIVKTGVVDSIVTNLKAKLEATAAKDTTRGLNFANKHKYEPAKYAGTKQSSKCALILTEGDSARGFAMNGLGHTGKDYYGVFPLRGKLLNTRTASRLKVSENKEVEAIMKIIGLDYGCSYKTEQERARLKYGKILVLTDQDLDGSHIKGLIMNFVDTFWPELLKNGFIISLNTPIVSATKMVKKEKKVIRFTNQQEFTKWREGNDSKGYTLTYHKGLGTNEPEDAVACFKDVEKKLLHYSWKSALDEDEDDNHRPYTVKHKDVTRDAITLCFEEKRANDRKRWINTYDPEDYIENDVREISYYDFFHRDMIAFSYYDVARSIPHMMDGFKPSQRKIFYTMYKNNSFGLEKTAKVVTIAGKVIEQSAYHHGEASLHEAIIGMAQKIIGTNNMNILYPKGNFGSRLMGGHDSAEPRYIFTFIEDLMKYVFVKEDQPVLTRNVDDDNTPVEPIFYVPVIPMVLVNGAYGIGTGYSCSIPPCNPRDIVANIYRILDGQSPKKIKPWYRHFKGTIEEVTDEGKKKYICRGVYERVDKNTIHITELPIGEWTDNYKMYLEHLVEVGAKMRSDNKKIEKEEASETKTKTAAAKSKAAKAKAKKAMLKEKAKNSKTAHVAKNNPIAEFIKDYSPNNTNFSVSFTITFCPGAIDKLLKAGKLEKGLKLVKTINISNMHMFDENNKVKKYDSYGEILRSFVPVRLMYYQKRKDYQLEEMKRDIKFYNWKIKFIEAILDNKIVLHKNGKGIAKDKLIEKLESLSFPKLENGSGNLSYSYLVEMAIYSLTAEEIERLRKLRDDKQEAMDHLTGLMPKDLMISELETFMTHYEKWDEEDNNAYDKNTNEKATKKKSKNSKIEVIDE